MPGMNAFILHWISEKLIFRMYAYSARAFIGSNLRSEPDHAIDN